MKAHYLGHVVFYVKNLDRSLAFYRDLLGFREVGRAFGGAAAALTSGRTHHELLLIEVGDPSTRTKATGTGLAQCFDFAQHGEPVEPDSAPHERAEPEGLHAPAPPHGHRLGLYHIGIKVGDSLDELRAAKRELEQAGVVITGMSDHTVSQSLYLADPDGNEVELYVDADPAIWKNNPAAVVAPIKPLRLS